MFTHTIPTKNPVGSESAFVKREIAHWGEDYVDDLIERGFVPSLLEEKGAFKWVWVLDPNRL